MLATKMSYPRRLIEVDLLIATVSEHARDGRSVHLGAPHLVGTQATPLLPRGRARRIVHRDVRPGVSGGIQDERVRRARPTLRHQGQW